MGGVKKTDFQRYEFYEALILTSEILTMDMRIHSSRELARN